MKREKRRYNLSLAIGSIILFMILLMILMDESLISSDPYSLDKGAEYVIDDEIIKIEHPVQPNPIDKLGTDPLGRDMLSVLISGTKVTVGIAFVGTILRLILGVGMVLYKKHLRKKVNLLKHIIVLIVGILIPYLILNTSFFRNLELGKSILAYGIVIGLFGWTRVFSLVSLDEETYRSMDNQGKKAFIKAIAPNIVINFFREMGISLFTLCILSLLGITVGVNKFANVETSWGVMPNYYPDWGGTLAISSQAIEKGAYWLVISPLLFFFMGILGFLLVSRGLSNNVKIWGSVVSPPMKKIINFVSPLQYIKDVKSFSWNKYRVIIKTLIILIIILYFIQPTNSDDIYKINISRAWEDLDYITKVAEEYGYNSHEAKDKIANYIAQELGEIYGLNPVFQEGLVQNIDGKGKNIAGYIWGRNSNNPLLLVADYGREFYEDSTSISALLELARSLGKKHNEQMASRSIVFLFVDGTLEDGKGLLNAIGNKHIGRRTFYMDLNYIGLSDVVYIDTSTVFSGNERHYKNIRLVKENIKDMNIPIKQEYLSDVFENAKIFGENKMSGLPISGASIEKCGECEVFNDNNINSIDKDKFEKHIQLLMNIVTEYAWSDKPWLGDKY